MLRLEDIMQTRFPSIDCDHTVAEVEELLASTQTTGAPVLNPDSSAFGIITQAELLRFRQNPSNNPNAAHAWEVCTTRPLTVSASESVSEVASVIVNERINHIIVVDDHGSVVGMLTSERLLEAYLQSETGSAASGSDTNELSSTSVSAGRANH